MLHGDNVTSQLSTAFPENEKRQVSIAKALSSAEALSVVKRRKNEEKGRKTGKIKNQGLVGERSPRAFLFLLPGLCALSFSLPQAPYSSKERKETSVEERVAKASHQIQRHWLRCAMAFGPKPSTQKLVRSISSLRLQ